MITGRCILCGGRIWTKDGYVESPTREFVQAQTHRLCHTGNFDPAAIKRAASILVVGCSNNEERDPTGVRLTCTHRCQVCDRISIRISRETRQRAKSEVLEALKTCEHVKERQKNVYCPRVSLKLSLPADDDQGGRNKGRGQQVTVWTNTQSRQLVTEQDVELAKCTVYGEDEARAKLQMQQSMVRSANQHTGTDQDECGKLAQELMVSIQEWKKTSNHILFDLLKLRELVAVLSRIYAHFAYRRDNWMCAVTAVKFSFLLQSLPCDYSLLRWLVRWFIRVYGVETDNNKTMLLNIIAGISPKQTRRRKGAKKRTFAEMNMKKPEVFSQDTIADCSDRTIDLMIDAIVQSVTCVLDKQQFKLDMPFGLDSQHNLAIVGVIRLLYTKPFSSESERDLVKSYAFKYVKLISAHIFKIIEGVPELRYFECKTTEELIQSIVYTSVSSALKRRNTTQLEMRDRRNNNEAMWADCTVNSSRLKSTMRKIKRVETEEKKVTSKSFPLSKESVNSIESEYVSRLGQIFAADVSNTPNAQT